MIVVLHGRIVVAVCCDAIQDEDNAEKEYCGQGPSHNHGAVVRFEPVTRVTPTYGCICSRCMHD